MYALGFVSVFDQVLDGYQAGDKDAMFNAYIRALNEDPAKYRVREGMGLAAAAAAASGEGRASRGGKGGGAVAAAAVATGDAAGGNKGGWGCSSSSKKKGRKPPHDAPAAQPDTSSCALAPTQYHASHVSDIAPSPFPHTHTPLVKPMPLGL